MSRDTMSMWNPCGNQENLETGSQSRPRPSMQGTKSTHRKMPVRLGMYLQQSAKSTKSPLPQRLNLNYVNDRKDEQVVKKVTRRNIENEQFGPQTTNHNLTASRSSKRKIVSGSKLPVGIAGCSRPRALKKLDVNRRENTTQSDLSTLTSPLLSLEEYAPRIEGQANAFQALMKLKNLNDRGDLRNMALRNASNKNMVSHIPSLAQYSQVLRPNIPDSPKLLLSVRKTSNTEARIYEILDTCKKSKRAKTLLTSVKKPDKCEDDEIKGLDKQLNNPYQEDSQTKETIVKVSTRESKKVNIPEAIAENEEENQRELYSGQSSLEKLVRSLIADHKEQVKIKQTSLALHEKSMNTLQVIMNMQSISITAQANGITDLVSLNISMEPEPTTAQAYGITDQVSLNISIDPQSTTAQAYGYTGTIPKQVSLNLSIDPQSTTAQAYGCTGTIPKQVSLNLSVEREPTTAQAYGCTGTVPKQESLNLSVEREPTTAQAYGYTGTIPKQVSLNLSVEREPTTGKKRRRSLRIAARTSGQMELNTPTLATTYLVSPAQSMSTDASSHVESTSKSDMNKVIPAINLDQSMSTDASSLVESTSKSDMKKLAKKRQSLVNYRDLRKSFHGILKTPMKTPVSKSARKVTLNVPDTPATFLSKRVQAAYELLLDDDDTDLINK